MKFWCKKYMIYMHNFFTITIYDVKRWIVEGVLLPAIGSIGIIGNPLLGIYLNILRVQCKSGVSVTQFSWVVHHPFYAMWKFLQTADTYLSTFITSLLKNSKELNLFNRAYVHGEFVKRNICVSGIFDTGYTFQEELKSFFFKINNSFAGFNY